MSKTYPVVGLNLIATALHLTRSRFPQAVHVPTILTISRNQHAAWSYIPTAHVAGLITLISS